MFTRYAAMIAAVILVAGGNTRAADGTIVWYDPTCHFFVLQLTEGFGLYEWKQGPELALGAIVTGDIGAGPEIEAALQGTTDRLTLVHWGDAKSSDALVRHAPGWCKSRKRK